MKKHHHIAQLEYDYITEGIYIGTNQCCQVQFDEQLLKLGIRADISLEEERLDSPVGVRYYLWLAVKDHHAPTMTQLKLGVSVLRHLVEAKEKIGVSPFILQLIF